MNVTGEEVVEWAERNGFILSKWQREAIRRYWDNGPLPPRPEPRKPVQTRRAQRRRHTRAERRRPQKLPQARYFVIVDELAREP